LSHTVRAGNFKAPGGFLGNWSAANWEDILIINLKLGKGDIAPQAPAHNITGKKFKGNSEL
jgi:hypothetical protein